MSDRQLRLHDTGSASAGEVSDTSTLQSPTETYIVMSIVSPDLVEKAIREMMEGKPCGCGRYEIDVRRKPSLSVTVCDWHRDWHKFWEELGKWVWYFGGK